MKRSDTMYILKILTDLCKIKEKIKIKNTFASIFKNLKDFCNYF